MREPLRDKARLEHIMSAAEAILERTKGMTLESLTSDRILFGGIVYHTMIIGEAAYHLSKPFKKQHSDTPWRIIEKMRHNLVHGYYKVDPNIVWSVINDDLPPLRDQIARYLAETDWEEWEKNDIVIIESATHKSLMETALRMKRDGLTPQQISRYTGLTTEEIEDI